jgi:hypothetical protein
MTFFHDGARALNDIDMLDVGKSSMPLSRTMLKRIAELRYWATDRARPVASGDAEDLDMDYTDDDTA